MSLATCFDPTAFPYQRAQTYVDLNPPAVLADEFYNSAQDAQARAFGALAGYSTTSTNEEFALPVGTTIPSAGDPFGQELAVFNNPGGLYQFQSAPTVTAGMHGVYRVDGVANGARGGGTTGFGVADAARYLGTMRWVFRARVRFSKYSIVNTSPPGLVVGLGEINDATNQLPSWIADGSGFWITWYYTGSTVTAIPTVDDEWVTLWIAVKDADGMARWYLQRDTDPEPMLLDTQPLPVPLIASAKRYFRNIVTAGAVATDYFEIDSIGMICER